MDSTVIVTLPSLSTSTLTLTRSGQWFETRICVTVLDPLSSAPDVSASGALESLPYGR